MSKTALITGITGQDGFYLASYLLSKGYVVVGIKRTTSTPNDHRIKLLMPHQNLFIVNGDVTDAFSIQRIVERYKPDEFYHLAAMSHVGKSFFTPKATEQINCGGTLNCLEAIRSIKPDTKFYFAASSEMFGDQMGTNMSKSFYQKLNENIPLQARSPYGASKIYGFNLTRQYRDSYNLFASAGILFNHECFSIYDTVVTKIDNKINIQRIVDLINLDVNKPLQQDMFPLKDVYIWDGIQWSKLQAITVRKPEENNNDMKIRTINTRNGIVNTTNHHNMIDLDGNRIRNDELDINDSLLHGQYPELDWFSYNNDNINKYDAELIGYIVGDGSISKKDVISISCLDDDNLKYLINTWNNISDNKLSVGKVYKSEYGYTRCLHLNDVNWVRRFNLYYEIYNSNHEKKVPSFILNADTNIKMSFLKGYNIADGLKKNNCTYLFRNFKTNSMQLAQGLLFCISQTTKQDFNITYEYDMKNDRYYYSINLLTPNKRIDINKEYIVNDMLNDNVPLRQISRETGISRKFIQKIDRGGHACAIHPMKLESKAIKKIVNNEVDFVADLCLESGKIMAGAGTIIAANSPLRGEHFVSRKITKGIADIIHQRADKIILGNIDACRDWGFAGCYVRAMHMIVNYNKPDDFVIATSQTHSVKEFLSLAFNIAGLGNFEPYVEISKEFYRPSDINILLGDASKAKNTLGWEPDVSFEKMVEIMVRYDIEEDLIKKRGFVYDALHIEEEVA